MVVEGDVELPGEQAAALQLPAQTPFLDDAADKGAPLLLVLQRLRETDRITLAWSEGHEALGEERDQHARPDKGLLRIELEPDARNLARGQSEEGHRRSHGEPAQRLLEVENVAPGDRVGRLHRSGTVGVE